MLLPVMNYLLLVYYPKVKNNNRKVLSTHCILIDNLISMTVNVQMQPGSTRFWFCHGLHVCGEKRGHKRRNQWQQNLFINIY